MKTILIKIFVALVLFFSWLITSRTPMMWEDVVYTLKADAALGAAMSNTEVADTIIIERYERVKTIKDLIQSSYYHYMNANGRLFPHFTSQAFGTIIGKTFFDVLNSIMFVMLITLVTLLIVGYSKNYWNWWVVVLSALWFLMPETNTCFFLMTYSLNYLWSSVLCSVFLLLYLNFDKIKVPTWLMPFCCIFSFCVGWSNETLVVGVAISVFIVNLHDIRLHRINIQKAIIGVCFILGVAFLCLSPGNFTRAGATLPLYNHFLSFARLRIFWLLIISWCLFSRSFEFIRKNSLLVIAIFFQAVFLFYVGYRNGRVLWGTEFFSLVLMLKIFAKEVRQRSLIYLSYALLFLLIIHISWLSYRSDVVKKQYDEVIALYLQSSDGIVYYDVHTESDLVNKYIPTPLCNNNLFELYTYSIYYTRNQKSLSIYPTSNMNNE